MQTHVLTIHFVTAIIPPLHGVTVPKTLCHPTHSAPSLESADLIKHLPEAMTIRPTHCLAEFVKVQWCYPSVA